MPREDRFTIVHLRDADAASLTKKHTEYAVIEARDRIKDGHPTGLRFLIGSCYMEVRRYLRAPFSRDRITLRETWSRMVMHSIIYWIAWETRSDRGLAWSRSESARLWTE